MANDLQSIVQQIADSGIVSPKRLEPFIPPQAHPTSVEELVRELVKQKQLTKFQAAQVAAGKAKALIFGNYTILEKIGAGGMGQVYKAIHRRMKRVVAIKTLQNSAMKDPETIARFLREVEAAGKLRHTNIVATDDADEANGVHFMVMEYVEGKDLSAYVKDHGPLSLEQTVDFTLQAARGLEFAHKKKVVHRDIKPSNLLLDREGTIKILDMGLARIESDGGSIATRSDLTETGTMMGTVDYVAPEQASDSKKADARADIYSLGCTMFYLLTGQAAYSGTSIMARLLAHRDQPIPWLTEQREDIPEDLNDVFQRMVAKSPDDRYQTMTEVIADLETVQANLSGAEKSGKGKESSSIKRTSSQTDGSLTQSIQALYARNQWLWISLASIGIGTLLFSIIVMTMSPRNGIMTIEVNQPGAVVVVDEQPLEVIEQDGKSFASIEISDGDHRLTVKKDGFDDYDQTVVFKAAEKLPKQVFLLERKGGAQKPPSAQK